MARIRRRSDMDTVRWYKRVFMIEMINGYEIDLTWPIYLAGLLLLFAIFS